MANYSSLLAAVNAAITANGTGAITGPVLNTVLQQMIVSLGQGGYIFKGRAIPTTDPGSPDQNVFYIATTPGTYTNFSSIVVAAGECAILKGSGTSWSKEETGIDLVSVSQNSQTGHTDINIGSDSYPVASVEEVNQLGQYCYDKIGNPNISINLDSIEKHNGLIVDGVWALLNNTSYKHIFLSVKGGQKYRFVAATPYNKIEYAFLTSTTEAEGEVPDFCDGYSDVVTRSASQYDVLIPDDCNYLYVYAQGGSVITLPTSCTLLASDGSIQEEIDDINSDISSINTAIGDKLSIVEQSLTTPQKETTLNNVGVTDTDSFFDLFETAETGYSAITLNSTISGEFITSNGSLAAYALYAVKVYSVSGIDKVYIKESRSSIESARIYAFYSDAACTSLVGEVGPTYDSTTINLEVNVPSGANYIGVSYREDVTSSYQVLKGDKTTLIKKIIRLAESSSQVFGICKISKWYFHFVRKNGGKYIIREFLNEGINNLFFLEAIHIGHITDEGVVIESTIQEAYRTDNIGPVMISNPVLFPGEDGGWSGGAHGKTIDNVEYPTAEQDSLSILCDGVSVSENGMYFGEVTITAKNKLYFPESITGDDLSSATLALNERIEIVLNEKMNVRVIEEAASNDVYISRYYGLQGIRIGFNEMYLFGNNLHIAFADMTTDLYLSRPERKIMMYNNNLHYDLTLKDIGLGMLNNTSRHYYGFFPVSVRKVYFMLIDTYGGVQPYVLESGKVIGWEGIYDVYFD